MSRRKKSLCEVKVIGRFRAQGQAAGGGGCTEILLRALLFGSEAHYGLDRDMDMATHLHF